MEGGAAGADVTSTVFLYSNLCIILFIMSKILIFCIFYYLCELNILFDDCFNLIVVHMRNEGFELLHLLFIDTFVHTLNFTALLRC